MFHFATDGSFCFCYKRHCGAARAAAAGLMLQAKCSFIYQFERINSRGDYFLEPAWNGAVMSLSNLTVCAFY
jgi:hypothetical protein